MPLAASRFAAVATLVFAGAGAKLLAVDEARLPPTRPSETITAPTPRLAVIRIGESEYVDLDEAAARLGLKPQLRDATHKVMFADKSSQLVLEPESREALVNGLRVFLGDKIVARKGQLYVSKIDFERCLTPQFRPGLGAPSLPLPKIIVLDPGHGGSDPGGVNPRLGFLEKTFTLDVALRLKPLLEKAGYKIVMTRTDDRLPASKDQDLIERANITNRAKGDLFISIHFNVVLKDPQNTRGVEVYTFTPANQHATDWWSDVKKDDQHFLTTDEPGNRFDHWNTICAQAMQRSLLQTLKAEDRGKKTMHLGVLRTINCPGVLVEPAIITNDAEARRIATPEYRQKIAEALADGVRNYSALIESLRPKPAATTAAASASNSR